MNGGWWALSGVLCLLVAGCAQSTSNLLEHEVVQMSSLRIASPVFSEGGFIPQKYTCRGMNINPPLTIDGIPPDTRSLVLIVDDPDAPMGTWTHWVLFNIPRILKIEENSTPANATLGLTSSQNSSYSGPCPPSGTHRYFFRLYALNTTLGLGTGATRDHVEQAMIGHSIGEAKIMGKYTRS